VREYELIYIIQPDATEEREAEIHAIVDGCVSRGEGTHLLRDDWGKRKLAYEIRKFQKGHYFQVNFLGDGAFVPELERQLRLDVDLLRFLTVLADESVMDVEARISQAREHEAEQVRRREERERLEEERVARAAAAAEQAKAEAATSEGTPSEDGESPLEAGTDESEPSSEGVGAKEAAPAEAGADESAESKE